MKNTIEKLLPIGTVIKLKEGKKRLMITGFYVAAEDNHDKLWDYCGCVFPEGILASDRVALFNHEQISEIFYYGLVDEEEKQFKTELNNVLNEKID